MRTAQIGPDLRLELFNPDEVKGYQTFILPKKKKKKINNNNNNHHHLLCIITIIIQRALKNSSQYTESERVKRSSDPAQTRKLLTK